MHRIIRMLRTSKVPPTPHAKCELPGCSKSTLISIVIDRGVGQASVTELDLAIAIK